MPFSVSRRLKASMSSVRNAMWPRSSGLIAFAYGSQPQNPVLPNVVRRAVADESHVSGIAGSGHHPGCAQRRFRFHVSTVR